jgi:hypothetical protein
MSAVAGLLDNGFNWRDIKITFSRNLPANDADAADMINKLVGVVSDETLLS